MDLLLVAFVSAAAVGIGAGGLLALLWRLRLNQEMDVPMPRAGYVLPTKEFWEETRLTVALFRRGQAGPGERYRLWARRSFLCGFAFGAAAVVMVAVHGV